MIEPCEVRVTVTAQLPAQHMCPFKPEVDSGEIEVSWRTSGGTVELHALADLIASQADHQVSHEEFTAWVADELSAMEGIEVVSVISHWVTAGAQVSVSAPLFTDETGGAA